MTEELRTCPAQYRPLNGTRYSSRRRALLLVRMRPRCCQSESQPRIFPSELVSVSQRTMPQLGGRSYLSRVDDADTRCPCACRSFRTSKNFSRQLKHFIVYHFALRTLRSDVRVIKSVKCNRELTSSATFLAVASGPVTLWSASMI